MVRGVARGSFRARSLGRLHGDEAALLDWELHCPYHRFFHRHPSCSNLDWYSSWYFGGAWSVGIQGHWRGVWDHYMLHRYPAGHCRFHLPAAISYRAHLCVLYIVCHLLFWRTLSQAGSVAVSSTYRADFPSSGHSTVDARAIVKTPLFRAQGTQWI